MDVHLVLVNRLGSLLRNSAVRLTDRLYRTIVVDWDESDQTKTGIYARMNFLSSVTVEEEELSTVVTSEQEFVFQEYVVK